MGARISWDGTRLAPGEDGPGRVFGLDPRCLEGSGVRGAWAHVCASSDPEARVPYDDPVVQGARRDALAWWIPLLG